MPETLEDLIGTAGRAVAWMHQCLSTEVSQRRATREFAAQELERMQAIMLLLEDLRGAADISLDREPKVHLSVTARRARRTA
jgi:hypothetical protein